MTTFPWKCFTGYLLPWQVSSKVSYLFEWCKRPMWDPQEILSDPTETQNDSRMMSAIIPFGGKMSIFSLSCCLWILHWAIFDWGEIGKASFCPFVCLFVFTFLIDIMTPAQLKVMTTKLCRYMRLRKPLKGFPIYGSFFYLRLVLASGYCHCLCLCISVSMCVCVSQSRTCPHDNSSPVQAMIIKLGVQLQNILV